MQLPIFDPQIGLSPNWYKYKSTSLYQLRQVLPIEELAKLLPPLSHKGAKGYFSNEGKIALQFLKAYEGCSDEKLRERLNTDFALQFFCGIYLGANESIKDKDLIWKTRVQVAEHLVIEKFQAILIERWKPELTDTRTGLGDATCYESYIKFPTDVKLLWDCVEWMHQLIRRLCKEMGLRKPRNKVKNQRAKQQSYSKQKRKAYKQRRRRKRALLHLLNKLLEQYEQVLIQVITLQTQPTQLLDQQTLDQLRCIEKIYEQQRYMFENQINSCPNRIVSLYKPYLRPIVRGKENKRVEFGAKLHTWQVDGLNFIEHFSFSAFHEGNRLKNGIAFHQKHFGSLRRLGADAIYATNANRRFCARFNIQTNFKRKGRPKADPVIRKQEAKMRHLIGKRRATVLEGSYGNDKNHYGLRKVKARNEKTEVLWIFFGMMTANAVKMAKRKVTSKKQPTRTRAA